MKYKTYSIEEVNEKIASNAKKIILDTDSQYREQLFNLANKILEKKETINFVILKFKEQVASEIEEKQ